MSEALALGRPETSGAAVRTIAMARSERETSHSGREKENRAGEPDHYRCVPDRPHPCECCHRAQSNSDLEQGNAVSKSVMLMQQMVRFG